MDRFRAWRRDKLNAIRENYAFWPATLSLAAAALAVLAAWFDSAVDLSGVARFGLGGDADVDSARAVLSTIAGSTISVAGVTFSMTIAAAVFASGQFGPRILASFMRDRVNQLVLGVFVATFVYALLSLRLVSASHAPTVAVLGAMLLAIISIGALIYYFNHLPESIRVSTVIAEIGGDMIARTAKAFPPPDPDAPGAAAAAAAAAGSRGDAAAEAADWPPGFSGDAVAIPARRDGYVRILDHETLVKAAAEAGVVARVAVEVGDFVAKGRPLAWASPAGAVDDSVRAAVRDVFVLGARRAAAESPSALATYLIDIAARALSPGVNDPLTAIACMDWLEAALRRAGVGAPQPALLRDDEGRPRVLRPSTDFEPFARLVLGSLRPYFADDRNAARRMMAALGALALDIRAPERRAVLLDEARVFAEAAMAAAGPAADREELAARLKLIERIGEGAVGRDEAIMANAWLGGAAGR